MNGFGKAVVNVVLTWRGHDFRQLVGDVSGRLSQTPQSGSQARDPLRPAVEGWFSSTCRASVRLNPNPPTAIAGSDIELVIPLAVRGHPWLRRKAGYPIRNSCVSRVEERHTRLGWRRYCSRRPVQSRRCLSPQLPALPSRRIEPCVRASRKVRVFRRTRTVFRLIMNGRSDSTLDAT